MGQQLTRFFLLIFFAKKREIYIRHGQLFGKGDYSRRSRCRGGDGLSYFAWLDSIPLVAGALFLFIILSSRGLLIGTKSKWTTDIASKTGYGAIHLKDVARARLYPILYTLTKQTQEQKRNHYVFDKYAADEFFGVSKIIDEFIVNYAK